MTGPPRILAIAGSDSSGGAGIQADIKTITMLGGYAMTAITAVTAQNTLGVHTVEVMSWDMVRQQVDACFNDIGAGRNGFSGPRLPQGHNPVKTYIPVARLSDMLLHPGAAVGSNLRRWSSQSTSL